MRTPDMLDGVIGAAILFYRDYSIGIIVDNFAGEGVASTGIELSTGRDIDVAINHDEEAIAMHRESSENAAPLPEHLEH